VTWQGRCPTCGLTRATFRPEETLDAYRVRCPDCRLDEIVARAELIERGSL
jgi:rubredoxin